MRCSYSFIILGPLLSSFQYLHDYTVKPSTGYASPGEASPLLSAGQGSWIISGWHPFGVPTTPLSPSQTSPGVLREGLRGPHHETDSDLLKWVHRRATEVVQGQEHLCCEDRLGE